MTQNVRSGLRLSKALNDGLNEAAKAIGISKNALMVKILWDWIQRQGDKTA